MSFFANKKVIGTFSVLLSLLMLSLTFAFIAVDRDVLAEKTTAVYYSSPLPQEASVGTLDFAKDNVLEDVLWLARVIYSETKRPDEQELVAWVVRNRVETAYRGASTYRQAVLDPWQFSAFNRNSPKRRHYLNLPVDSRAPGFQTAVAIAHDVLNAPAYERPFGLTTRHFYSERSMVGRSAPAWARGHRPVALDRPVDPRRFRFYANVL
jgi:hypothetical protein